MTATDLPAPGTQMDAEAVGALADRAAQVLDALRAGLADDEARSLEVRYGAKDASALLGVTPAGLYRAQDDGLVLSPAARSGYTLAELNEARRALGVLPWRDEADEPVILAVQNFKGGVGKSTVAVHLSQYLAQKGYRVLLVDADSQASATAAFGYNPDAEVGENETLLPLLMDGAVRDLAYCVRATHWDGLDLVPANLDLYNAEYMLGHQLAQDASAVNRLRAGLRATAAAYDVVVIDPPPALGMVSLSVVQAANAVLVPCPPLTLDFASTATFLSMMAQVMDTLARTGAEARYRFVRFIATKTDPNKAAQAALREAMGEVFAGHVLDTPLLTSAEYDAASLGMRSLYEVTEGRGRGYARARRNMDQVFGELEAAIRGSWPSVRPGAGALGEAA